MSTDRDVAADIAATAAVIAGKRKISDGTHNWLGHEMGTGAAKIDEMLLTGATKEQMETARGGVDQHLRHLKKFHGLTIAHSGGVYRFAINSTDIHKDANTTTTADKPKRNPATTQQESQIADHTVSANQLSAHNKPERLHQIKLILEVGVVAVTLIGGIIALLVKTR